MGHEMKSIKIIFFFILILFYYSCSDENNTIIYQGNNDEIYPLSLGNNWQYSKITYDINYNIITKDTISTEIETSYLKNGIEWFGIKFSWYDLTP